MYRNNTGNVRTNVTLRCVCETIVAVESSITLFVCTCARAHGCMRVRLRAVVRALGRVHACACI